MLGARCWMILPIAVGWMSTHDGGEPAKSKRLSPTPPEPLSTEPMVLAPINALVPTLPKCSRGRHATHVQHVDARLIEKRVALRGILTFAPSWSCRCKECETTWMIVDPRALRLDDSTTAIKISQSGQKLRYRSGRPFPWTVVARGAFPEPPDIDVVASGVLSRRGVEKDLLKDLLLEDAQLCRVRRGPDRPAKPLIHPSAAVRILPVHCPEGLNGLRF